jgi:hypothetical protein
MVDRVVSFSETVRVFGYALSAEERSFKRRAYSDTKVNCHSDRLRAYRSAPVTELYKHGK